MQATSAGLADDPQTFDPNDQFALDVSSAGLSARPYFEPDDIAGIEAALGRKIAPEEQWVISQHVGEGYYQLVVGVDDSPAEPGKKVIGLEFTNEHGEREFLTLVVATDEEAFPIASHWERSGRNVSKHYDARFDFRLKPIRPRRCHAPRARAPRPATNARRRGSRRSPTRSRDDRGDPGGGEPPGDDPEHPLSQPELEQFSCATGAHESGAITLCLQCGWNSTHGHLPWQQERAT